MGLRFQVTVEVDVDLDEPCSVQELARLQEQLGPEEIADLLNPEQPITPAQTRAVIWSKLVSMFPDVQIDQFDSINELATADG